MEEKMKLPFDKIYCLHLAENEDRYKHIMSEFKRIGISDDVDIWWTCKRNISNLIGINLKSLHDDWYNYVFRQNRDVYGGVFNCAFEHYTIIKQAYLRGYNSILILEDDIKFNGDLSVIKKCIDNIPNDYDIIKFYNTESSMYDIFDCTNKPILFLNKYSQSFLHIKNSTLCYAVSRNGMKKIIDEYNRKFSAADIVLENIKSNNDVNDKFYVLNYNFICRPNNQFSSNIIGDINY